MKLTILLALLVVAIVVTINSRNKRAREAQASAALARQRAARRNRVPDVSSNLKGVTASQTMQPYRPSDASQPRDERVA
jgi:hypothetical protein